MRFQKNRLFICAFILTIALTAQTSTSSKTYRKERDKLHAIQHTKLKVAFDFSKKELIGEEWITLSPHFYATNTVVLDAKAMLIHSITLHDKNLKYKYDSKKIAIELPKVYQKEEKYTLHIKYTARPEKVAQKGSAAITGAKGLYFIDAKNDEGKKKAMQIWTQGETEASSCWFPTIDSPNQKTSQEIYITVPKKFKTLSNGTLENQTIHTNGTRTDYWNFTQKHAPYLFFMGIGEFEIIKDAYKNIPVHYYVEKEYAAYAKQIFGATPEMMGFFSEITRIEYPWNAYNQIVGRDYVSGAMENTTAVIHSESAYQTPGQLIDENVQEDIIAHELFHHWFGNFVTAESWSNITLNESFANYSQYLWREHKHGKDDADAHLLKNVAAYKQGSHSEKELVRFYYVNKEDVFDVVSYNKGGAILHMLRNYIGDEAFYEGMHAYLTTHAYQAAEAHQLRLAYEKVTGKDLNWFFNQWYFGSGHPKVEVSYDYNTLEKKVTVNIYQTEKTFQFPLSIAIVENGKVHHKNVFVSTKDASFTFEYAKIPEIILVNSDGVLLAEFSETKTLRQYISQLKHANYYGHQKEALLEIAKNQEDKEAFNAIVAALNNPFYKIRQLALENINLSYKHTKRVIIDQIKSIATTDKKTIVRAAAIETLGKLTEPENMPIFMEALQSKSYSVLGKTLVAIYYIDKKKAVQLSKELPTAVRKIIATPLTRIFLEEKDETEMVFIAKNVLSGMFLTNDSRTKSLYHKAYEKIAKSNATEAIQNLIDDMVVKAKKYKHYNFDKTAIGLMQQMVNDQKESGVSNRLKHVEIIRTGMAEILR